MIIDYFPALAREFLVRILFQYSAATSTVTCVASPRARTTNLIGPDAVEERLHRTLGRVQATEAAVRILGKPVGSSDRNILCLDNSDRVDCKVGQQGET